MYVNRLIFSIMIESCKYFIRPIKTLLILKVYILFKVQ